MRVVVVLLLVLAASVLQAQSVTISQEQLAELTAILKDYVRITEMLEASLASSERRTTALETGFEAYKQTVDSELLPKAIRLERENFWLKVGLGAAGAVAAGALLLSLFH